MKQMLAVSNLYDYFQTAAHSTPEAPCLWVNECLYSYSEMEREAKRLHQALGCLEEEDRFVGVLAYRSLMAYAGILGVLRSGRAYVPLNPHHPSERNGAVLASAGMQCLLVDGEGAESLLQMEKLPRQLKWVVASEEARPLAEKLQAAHPQVTLLFPSKESENEAQPRSEFAYMIFTSGSTGQPKGVPISHGNVCAYVNLQHAHYQPDGSDRFTQLFELTFDLSVHDLFLCWAAGASLYVPPRSQLMAHARFIREHALSFYFSVPSVLLAMSRLRMLKPGSLPSLKVALVCGEPLPLTMGKALKEAAPQAQVENLYGPTEATIAITRYEVGLEEIKAENGVISIGKAFSQHETRVVDLDGNDAGEGELWLSGPQVGSQYWNAPDKTAHSFVMESGTLYYRTGDWVRKDAEGDIQYLSRIDNQVKIKGHRVELAEVSGCAEAAGIEFCIPIPHPILEGIAQGLVAFIPQESASETQKILQVCTEKLPPYMVPSRLIPIAELPLNANGKVDLRRLANMVP